MRIQSLDYMIFIYATMSNIFIGVIYFFINFIGVSMYNDIFALSLHLYNLIVV